jgi:hypothetical protein
MPRTEYHKEELEGHKLEIQEILADLNAPGSSLDENINADERIPHPASVDLQGTTTTVPESGTP